jgi:hypothetical protein
MKFSNKEGMQWRDEHTDKPILTTDDAKRIANIVESVGLIPTPNDYYWRSRRTGNLVADSQDLRKSRLDAITRGNIIPDIKICDSVCS